MGSDIQSLAIPAKACDSAVIHTAGLITREFLYSHSILQPRLYTPSFLSSAAHDCALPDSECVGFKF